MAIFCWDVGRRREIPSFPIMGRYVPVILVNLSLIFGDSGEPLYMAELFNFR